MCFSESEHVFLNLTRPMREVLCSAGGVSGAQRDEVGTGRQREGREEKSPSPCLDPGCWPLVLSLWREGKALLRARRMLLTSVLPLF